MVRTATGRTDRAGRGAAPRARLTVPTVVARVPRPRRTLRRADLQRRGCPITDDLGKGRGRFDGVEPAFDLAAPVAQGVADADGARSLSFAKQVTRPIRNREARVTEPHVA